MVKATTKKPARKAAAKKSAAKKSTAKKGAVKKTARKAMAKKRPMKKAAAKKRIRQEIGGEKDRQEGPGKKGQRQEGGAQTGRPQTAAAAAAGSSGDRLTTSREELETAGRGSRSPCLRQGILSRRRLSLLAVAGGFIRFHCEGGKSSRRPLRGLAHGMKRRQMRAGP